ncbi:MAG: hypothetical protein V4596_13875 [Bdellovibrionota bacterium]
MSKNKSFEADYLNSWKIIFEKELRRTIIIEMGYGGLDTNTNIRFKNDRQKIHSKKIESKDLIKFQQSFKSLCKKHNIFKEGPRNKLENGPVRVESKSGLGWYGLPRFLVEDCSRLNIKLETYINEISESIKKRHRRRIPLDVATSLLCLMHNCSNDKSKLEDLKNLLKPKGYVDKTIGKTIEIMRDKVLSQKLNSSEVARIKKFKITWNPCESSKGSPFNTVWINHLKHHLIKVILSEGKPKIIKNFDGVEVEKQKLLEKIELFGLKKPNDGLTFLHEIGKWAQNL